MSSRLGKYLIFGSAILALTACASSVPPNFEYQTSLRGEQGFIGQSERLSAAASLLDGGVVMDPEPALKAALADADVTVRKWGLRYFNSDWARYQVVLDADIQREDMKTKCREVSTETPVGAPTLKDLRADEGAELQRQLEALISACVRYAADLT